MAMRCDDCGLLLDSDGLETGYCTGCGPVSGEVQTYQDIQTGIPTPAQMADYLLHGYPEAGRQAGC